MSNPPPNFGCDLVYEHDVDDTSLGSAQKSFYTLLQEPASSLSTGQLISSAGTSKFLKSSLKSIQTLIETELNSSKSIENSKHRGRTESLPVIWTIFCHSSFLSSLVKVTVRLPEISSVECLCLAFLAELLSGEGTWVCKDSSAGFTSTFIISSDRGSAAQPLNLRETMHRRLGEFFPATASAAAAPRRVVLHAHWAPTSPHWDRTLGNLNSGPLFKVATLIAAKCAAQADPREEAGDCFALLPLPGLAAPPAAAAALLDAAAQEQLSAAAAAEPACRSRAAADPEPAIRQISAAPAPAVLHPDGGPALRGEPVAAASARRVAAAVEIGIV